MPKLQVLTLSLTLLSLVLSETQVAVAVPNDGQDIWRVDLRAVAWQNADEQRFHQLKYYRWENGRWQASDAETFFGTQLPEIPLIVFAPGYSLTPQQVTRVGFGIVQTFDPSKPCRVVLWNWYSERGVGNIRRDVRNKIPVANNAAGFLTLFLQSLEPQSKVCLFGFSFGSRIVCNAVETLRTSERQPEGLRLHLVLLGAASDHDWLTKGNRHEKVPQIVEKILITYNPEDRVLRFYPLMHTFRHRPVALGLEGLSVRSIAPEFRDQFENVNVYRYIGKKHKTLLHIQTPAVRSRIDTYFFFE